MPKKVQSAIFILSILFSFQAQSSAEAEPLWQLDHSKTGVKPHFILQCINLIDQQKLSEAKQAGAQLDIETQEMCQQGKRNKAQNMALGFAHKIQKSKELLAYLKCTKNAQPPYNQMQIMMKRYFISNLRFTHVCDTF